MSPGSSSFLHWLTALKPSRVHIVSPHLDDAVLSVHGLMRSSLASICEVTTVFTTPGPDADPSWARASGFRNPEDEFAARRQEDSRAMSRLGIAFRHAGLYADRWDDNEAARLASELIPAGPRDGQQPVVLLPAASGQPMGAAQRLLRRLARIPFGADAHPEHRIVRDRMFHALSSRGFDRIVFYAEIPYSWNESRKHLSRSLQMLCGRPLAGYVIDPDVADKLSAVFEYESQVGPILGVKRSYQMKVMSRREYYLVMQGF